MNNLKYSYYEYENALAKKKIFEIDESIILKILQQNPRISKKDFIAKYKSFLN